MRKNILHFIDYFHPLFSRIMPLQTYRYAAFGGINTILGLLVWYLSYHLIFDKMIVNIGFYVFKPYTAALVLSSFFSFSFGFLVNKFIVFTNSNLKGRIQLFRYFLSFIFNVFLNYFVLRLLIEQLKLAPFVSQLMTTALVITASFLSQKHFSFRVKKAS